MDSSAVTPKENQTVKMEWIEFQEQAVKAKTRFWNVTPTDAPWDVLGRIKWYSPWRKYCFFPSNGAITTYTVFEWKCLRAIAQFCEDQTKLHKENSREVRNVQP
jgi:hypothetical protein